MYVNWNENGVLKDGIPVEAVSFWSGVLEYKNLLGNNPYHHLATYALACLTTPTSNAVVERMFSYVTAIKTKSRNKMSSSMLDAIVRIRTHLYFRDKCCKNFVPSKRMLKLFTQDIYRTEANNSSSPDDEDGFLELVEVDNDVKKLLKLN